MPFLSRLQPNRQTGGSKTADDQQFEATLRKTAHEFDSDKLLFKTLLKKKERVFLSESQDGLLFIGHLVLCTRKLPKNINKGLNFAY